MNASTVDFHHLDVCHAWRTQKDVNLISFTSIFHSLIDTWKFYLFNNNLICLTTESVEHSPIIYLALFFAFSDALDGANECWK